MFVQASVFLVCDLGKDPSQPGLRINVIELGGFDQSEGYGSLFVEWVQFATAASAALAMRASVSREIYGFQPEIP